MLGALGALINMADGVERFAELASSLCVLLACPFEALYDCILEQMFPLWPGKHTKT